jgi:hypothetical protein
MEDSTLFIFIIIVAAIMVSEDRMLTVLAASVALNIALLFSAEQTCGAIASAHATAKDSAQSAAAAAIKSAVEPLASDAIDDMYGPQYNAWSAHGRSYDMYPDVKPHVGVSCAENDYSVDTLGTLMTQKRGTRDKRAMDGAITKGVDYYKYHYADELDKEEAKPWWGRHEY